MKYRELLDILENLDAEQMEMDVTVYSSQEDEFHPVTKCVINGTLQSDSTDVLDEYHPYLKI